MKLFFNYADRVTLTRLSIFVFVYILAIGIFIQTILLPYVFPSLHAGNGLMVGLDSIKYHEIAIEKANEIGNIGWQAWELKPQTYGPAGILSIMYVVFSPKPWVFLFVNAFLKSIATIALYRIVFKLTSSRSISAISMMPFIFFPSSLNWDSQILNDGFIIAGIFLIFDGMLDLLNSKEQKSKHSQSLRGFFEVILGLGLVYLVKSYYFIFLLPIPVSALIYILIKQFISYKVQSRNHYYLQFFLILSIAIGQSLVGTYFNDNLSVQIQDKNLLFEEANSDIENRNLGLENSNLGLENKDSSFETILYSFLSPISKIRKSFNNYESSGSGIDTHINFSNSKDVFLYLPRAVQITFLAPFPNFWLAEGAKPSSSMFRIFSGFEMLISYFLLVYFFSAIIKWRKNYKLLFISGISVVLLIIQGLVISNVGALYRFRFPFFMIIITCGFAYFLSLVSSKKAIALRENCDPA